MKRRIMSILVVLSMALSLMPFFALPASAAIAAIKPAVGDGSPENPYRIASEENLAWFHGQLASGNSSLCADLMKDFTWSGWTRINNYTGTLDGRNHTLDLGNFSGLFARATNATIKNLHIVGNINQPGISAIAGFVGVPNNTYLKNCSYKGNIYGNDQIGGLLGSGSGRVDECWYEGVLSGYHTGHGGSSEGGGIVGWAQGVAISRTYSNFSYNSTIVFPGGMSATYRYNASATDCYVTNINDGAIGCALGASSATRSFVYNGRNTFDTSVYSEVNGWKYEAGMSHPILRQSVEPSSKNRTIVLAEGDEATLNLPDYFDLILSEDKVYNQDGCFNYSIVNGSTADKSVFDASIGGMTTESVTLSSIDSEDTDKIHINADVDMGKYNVTVHAVDTCSERNTKYEDFDISLEIIVQRRVPEPKVLVNDLEYHRWQTLVAIPITREWHWDDDTICPKDTNTTGYKVYFPCEDWITADNYATYYDTTALDDSFTYSYDAATNSIVTTLKVNVLESDESPRSMTITVLDADYPDSSPKPIPNATVTGEYDDEFVSENGHVTDAKGEVYAEISPGFEELNVSADGYQSKTETVEILGKPNTNAPVLKLVPVRTAYTACDVRERETENPIPNAQVSIMKISSEPTLAWNGGADSLTVDAKTEFTLPDGFPDGRFKITNATYGWSHDDVAYMKVENGEYRYYTDAACTVLASDQTLASVLHAVKLSEPMYDLRIDKATDGDAKHYTATVKLSNINATYGTFGISWDTDLFTFDPATGIHLGTDIKGGLTTPESSLLYNKTWTNDLGYYDFVWSANNGNDSVVDAELEAKTIATFDFYLKNADIALADMITVDTFSIQPWTDTKAARDWAAAKKAENPDFDPKFWEYWRECDTDNLRNNLKPGRIDAIYSVVNGVETNGFFQVAVNGDLGGSDPSSFYDAKTDLRYDFDIKNSVIRFHVTDKYKGDEIENARIRLFERTATRVLGQKNTNYLGRANFTVNTANTDSPEFAYDVLLKGYWPIPESGLTGDRPHIGAETGKATEVEVLLEKKIYHDTEIKGYGAQTLDLVKSADLGGERYAYNNRDFHFRIKGAKGFRITKYPTKAYVTIGDEDAGSTKVENLELSPNENGLFTLPAEYLIQDEISIEKMNALGYEDVPLVQPDDEGFRSYNIEVQFDNFEVMELDYLVEGMTNEHGTVTYKADTPFADGLEPFVPDAYAGTKEHDIKVKTKKSVRDENDKTIILEAANHKTGTFTFEADEGYMVEKVYVNGLQIHTYDDLKKFTYTFGDVDMDCSIIVMFWDGETPSTDSVLTLVVGDWGYVHVSSPVAEDDLMCTRRTYLNPEANLEFKTDAAKFSDDYELYRVEKEVEGEPRVNITGLNTDGKYSVEPVEGKNVVTYVTFKNRLAEITPTLFVKSYVYFGEGVADPAGILIYNYYDSVEIDMTADADNSWLVRGAMISPYEDLEDISEFEFEEKKPQNTYRYDSLQENIAIGAVFMEKAYPIQGLVDLSQRSNITSAAPLRGATITFVRLEQDEETGEWVEKTKQVPFKTDSTASRTDSVFSTELPVGKWNVYVSKQGYMTYKLTEFDMPGPTNETDVYLFGTPDGKSGTQQKVVPYIGSTETGDSISLTDAANVKSGMRGGVSKTIFNMADVDNNNSADHIDLAYVWKNFNTRMIVQDYGTFCIEGSATPSAN